MSGEAPALEAKPGAPAAPAAGAPPAGNPAPPAPAAPAPAAVVTPPAPPVPPTAAEIKLALPAKDAAIDQARVDELTAFAKANGLSQAAAEKLLERENAGAAAANANTEAANAKALADAKTAWIAETSKDEALAGKDGKLLVATKEIAGKALKWHNDPALDQMLANTGFGEHPVVLRFLKHIGDALGEDGLPIAGAIVEKPKPKSLADHYRT